MAMFEPENMLTLSGIYGGMPARESLAGDYIASYGETNFPDRDVDWSVVDNQAGYYLWLRSFDQLVGELVEDGSPIRIPEGA